jgi:dTDP-4-dehydro-6-deoxy-alpha-D-glucopyranose 2,3-dehydratase
MMNPPENHLAFLKSAFCNEGYFVSNKALFEKLNEENRNVKVRIEKTLFSKLSSWVFDEAEGILKHESGRFFSIEGVQVQTNWGKRNSWSQPIINQPEVGFLGFIAKEFSGILHFLVQAKIEPGNINNLQLSPTLQATKSNYSRVHKGKQPEYLEYFINAKPHQVLLDQLQSEQGVRFLKKRNRNIIIRVDEDIEVKPHFFWLTLAQIKGLIQNDNLVNMDTRTVISGISFYALPGNGPEAITSQVIKDHQGTLQGAFLRSALTASGSEKTLEEIISIITQFKTDYCLNVNNVPIKSMNDWVCDDKEIHHVNKKYFSVIPVKVEIENREVTSWHQPMIEPAYTGLCAFVCKEINGLMHFAVHARVECGNLDIMEFAPTVQCLLPENPTEEEANVPFLQYVLTAPKEQVIYDTFQSEEGGRFYREQNRNMIVVSGDEIPTGLPKGYYWLSLYQLHYFLKFNNYINIQARSLIAAISFI